MDTEDRSILNAEGGLFDESLYGDDEYVQGWTLAAINRTEWDFEGRPTAPSRRI